MPTFKKMIGSLMMFILLVFPLLLSPSLCLCTQESSSSSSSLNGHQFKRPLIVEFPEQEDMDININNNELELECTTWRVAAEANNLNPWKTIPLECADYVNKYMTGKGYKLDLQKVSNEASVFATTVNLGDDSKDVWVFDIDETLLSNLPYYVNHGYGLEVFDGVEFDKWVATAMAPAIEASLRLYEEVLSLGFKVFLLTGRSEKLRDVTVQNLMNVGVKNWDKLILRDTEDHGKLAVDFKSEKRNEMVKEGFRIVGNSGDQWSDLLGQSMSSRSFKLPNPMYYIP